MHTLIRILLTSFILGLFLLHLNGWWTIGVIEQLERISYDTRVRLSLTEDIDDRVVIIDIDEKSTTAEGQWPWPRRKLAKLVDTLYEVYEVRVLGLDTVMPEPDGHSFAPLLEELAGEPGSEDSRAVGRWLAQRRAQWDDDAIFAASLRKHQPVLGFVFKGAYDHGAALGSIPEPLFAQEKEMPAIYVRAESYTGNLPILQQATPYAGFFDNPTLDSDGVFRRVPLLQSYDNAVYGSLALMTLWRALGGPELILDYDSGGGPRTPLNLETLDVGPVSVPVDENVAILVPYRGRQGSFRYYSVTDILNQRIDPAELKDRIALLGTSAPGLRDVRTTPVGQSFNGVEVHANLISGMLDDRIKAKVPYLVGIETTLLLFISVLLTFVFPRIPPIWGTAMVIALVLGLTGLSFGMWSAADFVVPLGGPLSFLLLVVLAQMTYGYFIEARAKREVARVFGQYVPPELVSEMAQDALALSMRSDSREMTVLFSDVRDFTSISEKLSPEELTQLMNQFLTPLTEVIHRKRGTIDKYMGDAVMAFWGAPLDDEDHARHALEAALEMVATMKLLAQEFSARGLPDMKIGVGVNTGVMSVGNMGSQFRMAYTVLGDAVNLGSRLEGLTKQYGVQVICSDTTRKLVQDWVYRELDVVRVKGKDEPVAIFEPLGLRANISDSLRKELSLYRRALQAYRHQNWSEAELQIYQLKKTSAHKIYDVYLKRIEIFKVEPPGPDWDGVFTYKTK